MNHTSNRYSSVIESNDLLKGSNNSQISDLQRRSVDDVSRVDLKHSNTVLSRGDSISIKSVPSLFQFRKSTEGPLSLGSNNAFYTPRSDKTLALFEKTSTALNQLFDKYSSLSKQEDGVEHQDYNIICNNLEDRIMMLESFKTDYTDLLEDRQEEFKKIQSNMSTVLTKKDKGTQDIVDSDTYWAICRKLFILESKLERCIGKLQFQIMELEYIGKIIPSDQYELSIRLSDTNRFRTKIKIEKNGHQVFDMRNFDIIPMIEDFLYIKFTELRPLNKSIVILDKKVPFVNNLIRSEPSIYTLWLSPNGTIKLKLIVQWNAILNDPELQMSLSSIESRFSDHSNKTDSTVRHRAESTSHKYANSRLSTNIENIFRSARLMTNSQSNISNIIEEEDKSSRQVSRKLSNDVRLSDPTEINEDSGFNLKSSSLKNLTVSSEQLPVICIDNGEVNETFVVDEIKSCVLMRKERVEIKFSEDQSSLNEEEFDSNKSEIPEPVISPKDIPPCHVDGLENDDAVIESPQVILSEANSYVEDGNDESMKISDNSHLTEENPPESVHSNLSVNTSPSLEEPVADDRSSSTNQIDNVIDESIASDIVPGEKVSEDRLSSTNVKIDNIIDESIASDIVPGGKVAENRSNSINQIDNVIDLKINESISSEIVSESQCEINKESGLLYPSSGNDSNECMELPEPQDSSDCLSSELTTATDNQSDSLP